MEGQNRSPHRGTGRATGPEVDAQHDGKQDLEGKPNGDAAEPTAVNNDRLNGNEAEPQPAGDNPEIDNANMDNTDMDAASLLTAGANPQHSKEPAGSRREDRRDARRRHCCRKITDYICRSKIWIPFTIIFCVIVACVVVLKAYAAPTLAKRISQDVVLTKSNSEKWKHPSGPTFLYVYVFNVSNAQAVIHEGALANLTEMGPYVYRIQSKKTGVVWNSNSTVSYSERDMFFFDRSKSSGLDSDSLMTVNMPLLTIYEKLKDQSSMFQRILRKMDTDIFIELTVRELLWGYESKPLKCLHDLQRFDILGIMSSFGTVPTTFGYMEGKNGTDGPVLNEYTGSKERLRLGRIYSWNYGRSLRFWSTARAKAIRGTDGTHFPPNIMTWKLEMFYPQLFRSFTLRHQSDSHYGGLKTKRFVIPNTNFYCFNGKLVRKMELRGNTTNTTELLEEDVETDENKTLESVQTRGNRSNHKHSFCVPKSSMKGLYSIAPANEGAPAAISLPHLLGADAFYLHQVNGLHPEEKKHRPFFDIDPLTGVTLNTRRKHQLNAHVNYSLILGNLSSSKSEYIPIFWVDLSAQIDEVSLKGIRLGHILSDVIRYALLAGTFMLIICPVTCIFTMSYCPRNIPPYGFRRLQENNGVRAAA